MAERRRLSTKLILAAMLIAPVIVFFALQAVSSATRAGSVEDVWFVRTDAGPKLVARDQITVGVASNVSVRHRLVVVDVATGKGVLRKKVDVPLELVGADRAGLWFRRKGDGGDLHLRSAQTLDRVEAKGATPPPAPPSLAAPTPVLSEATLPGGARLAAGATSDDAVMLDSARFPEAAIVAGGRTREPILLTDPPSALVLSRAAEGLRVSRVDAAGRSLWDAPLERQRVLRSAARVGEVVVLVTSGAARDFAIGLDVRTGATKWVHHF